MTVASEGLVEHDAARTLRVRGLWALGVGTVIGGDFFGWQAVLAFGFGAALVALLASSLLYLLLASSVAELAALLEHGAGPSQFAFACFGTRVAFFVGLCETLKCFFVVGAVAWGLASYLGAIFETSMSLLPLFWVLSVFALTAVNLAGAQSSALAQMFTSVVSVVLLSVFYVGALGRGTDFNNLALEGKGMFDGLTASGLMAVAPFGLWFFLGIEELPLAMEVTVNPRQSMPRGLLASWATLVVLGLLTLFLSCAVPPGTTILATKDYPLLEGYYYAFGRSQATRWGCLTLVIGMVCPLQAFIFATGHLVAQMARDGHFPAALAQAGRSGAPRAAFIATAVASLALLFVMLAFMSDVSAVGYMTIAACLLVTMPSYIIQLSSFLYLRWTQPEASRVFVSPFGFLGGVVAIMLCIAFLVCVLYMPVADVRYLYGEALAAGLLLVGIIAREVASRSGTRQAAGEPDSHCIETRPSQVALSNRNV